VATISRRFHIVLVILASLAPLVWLSPGLPLKGVDSYFSLHPEGRLTSSLYAWDARISAGAATADLITTGLNFVQGTLAEMGTPLVLIQALVLVALATSAAVGMYKLTEEVLPEHSDPEHRQLVAAFVALLWVANPFALSFVWNQQLLIQFTWAVVPWLMMLLARSVWRPHDLLRHCTLTLLVTILGAAGFPHAYLVPIGLLLLIFGVGVVLSSPKRAMACRNVAVFFAAFGTGLAWWLIPSITSLNDLYRFARLHGPSIDQFLYASRFSDLENVITLTGIPQLHDDFRGTPYIHWHWLFTAFPGDVLKYVLPMTASIGAIAGATIRWRRSVPAALSASVLVGTFLSKGYNEPLKRVNLALLDLPFGEAFRHPVDKFALILVPGLCLLFGFGVDWLLRTRGLLPVGWMVLIVSCGWLTSPWWTGDVVPDGRGILRSARVEMPASYDRMGHVLDELRTAGKTMILPYSPNGEAAYLWPSGVQPNLDPLLQDWATDRSFMAHPVGNPYADMSSTLLAKSVLNRDRRAFSLARLFGVDSWLVHADWATDYMPRPISPQFATRFLQSSERAFFGPREVRSTRGLKLFAQPALPVVYTAQSVITIQRGGALPSLLQIAHRVRDERFPALVPSQLPPSSPTAVDPRSRTSWFRKDPTTFTGRLRTQGPTLLIFLQSFDRDWKLSIANQEVPERFHVVVNGFANGWLLNSSRDGGNLTGAQRTTRSSESVGVSKELAAGVTPHASNPRTTVDWTLSFEPQEAFDLGLLVGVVLLAVSAIVLIRERIRTPRGEG
jgi:hypothetical protein